MLQLNYMTIKTDIHWTFKSQDNSKSDVGGNIDEEDTPLSI